MFDISKNGIIRVTRGDSFSLEVFINLGTVVEPLQYFLTGEDKLYFALMEPNQPFECALIRRTFTEQDANEEGLVVMNFDSEMTECLLPGNYYYTVKLVRDGDESGKVDTIISKTKFVILD